MMRSMLHLALLRTASTLVPTPLRTEWLQEWNSELWHICQANLLSDRAIIGFCLGAFADGCSLRRQTWHPRRSHFTTSGSAVRCLFLLAALLAASYSVSLLSPGVRAQSQPAFRGFRHDLVLIRAERNSGDATSTIQPAQFQYWKNRRQQLFDDFAFYQIIPASGPISLARASTNLFDLLGVPLNLTSPAAEQHSNIPSAILSNDLWKRQFASDPRVAGRIVQLGSQRATVAGIAPAGFHCLPAKVDAWLVEPNTDSFSVGTGFLIAHIVSSQSHNLWRNFGLFTSRLPDGTVNDFFCSPLEDRISNPHLVFLFNVIVAFLALPAITSLSLGVYRFRSPWLSWSTRIRRWSFLTAKIALLLSAAFFLSLDLAYAPTVLTPSSAQSIERVAWFLLCLFGLQWALRDQRRRCPICLSRLGHAATVGYPSNSFLAWSGTELACSGGHGFLHVPEPPTSWFSTQRWLQLDASWQVLFRNPNAV